MGIVKYSFSGANQDITKSKHPFQYYFDGQHIKITATEDQSTGSIMNEKGNTSVVTIPTVTINESTSTITYGTSTLVYDSTNEIASQIASGSLPTSSSDQIIIGHIETRDGLVLWTTDSVGFDCIWHLDNILSDVYTLKLLYVRDFNFNINKPIQAVYNFENENIQKIYWVDGAHQIRYINITHDSIEGNTPLIDIPINTINFVGNILFSQPVVTGVLNGGTHTAGMIQYSFNLYRLNGSQTKLSPLSQLVALDKGPQLGGGELNETVSTIPIIQLDNLDISYTHIKIYAIKYTSFNELPSVSLIDERELGTNTSLTIYDDGSIIETLTLEEFLFLGSNPIIPAHIESKDSRLFLANIQDTAFEIPDILDLRAYSFNQSSSTTKVWRDPVVINDVLDVSQNFVTIPSDWGFDLQHPSINLEYKTRKYQKSSSVIGGEGKYIKYELVSKTASQLTHLPEEYRFFKDGELYRIGIEFFNNLGQTSAPQWIADFRAQTGNLEGSYNTLKVTLTADFYTWLNTYTFETIASIPVGYRIIRADRTPQDRTIICQGGLTQMMCQTTEKKSEHQYWKIESNRRVASDDLKKMPIPVTRGYLSNMNPLGKTDHLKMMNEESDYGSGSGEFPNEEIYSGTAGSTKRQQSWQYTKMFQMHSPEVLFDSGVAFNSSMRMKIKGVVKRTKTSIWLKRINITNKTIVRSERDDNVDNNTLLGISYIKFLALFGPSDKGSEMDHQLIYREWGTFLPSSSINEYDIYGTPEVTARSQGVTNYNGDGDFQYVNTLEGFLTDENDDESTKNAAIVSMNSSGAKCITLVEGVANVPSVEFRRGLDEIHTEIGIAEHDGLMLAELIITDANVAIGNIYGGNSFEDRSRTTYIEIGNYAPIATTFVQIDNPGDTYVGTFQFARISKLDNEILDDQVLQLTEIVSYPVESTIDLKNRNDLSLFDWDSEFQPTYDEYVKYNRVYSQQPTLVGNTSEDFTFRRIKGFDTRIQATKLKIPNESVDSWTDILENEVMDLDGKYGSISNIMVWKDNMYSFQDEAISSISINPRIQIQGSDGVALELGTGGILYDWTYITTKSGSINKWGIIAGKKGIYYYDALNKAIGRIPDAINTLLSDAKGMHSYFSSNYNYNLLKVDNPLLATGVVFGYDNLNNDVYFTLMQGDKSFTRCYNELKDAFIDLKTYIPSRYINKGEKLIISDSTNKVLWEQFKGDYNIFYGTPQSSFVILQVNPEDISTVFDTIQYNSEIYLNDIDQPEKTLTHIHAYNEYQDSGKIPLVVGRDKNLRRKFREWKAAIPREGRNRIRNPWIFLKLELENTSNYKMILHDITINYTV